MIEFVKELLRTPAGSFGFIFAFIVLAFWLCHWVTKYLTKINSNHGHLTDSLSSATSSIDEIRRDLAYIKGTLDIMKRNTNDGYTQRNSPISLTEKGKKEVEENGLYDLVDRNWSVIYQAIEQNVVNKNAYDIQTYCMETPATNPEKFFAESDILIIKELAFKKGLAFMTYTNMLGVIIRDKYFKQKGINIDEVDKHDPHQH